MRQTRRDWRREVRKRFGRPQVVFEFACRSSQLAQTELSRNKSGTLCILRTLTSCIVYLLYGIFVASLGGGIVLRCTGGGCSRGSTEKTSHQRGGRKQFYVDAEWPYGCVDAENRGDKAEVQCA